MNWLC